MDICEGLTFNFKEADKRLVGSEWNYSEFNEFAKIYYVNEGRGKVIVGNRELILKPGYLYLIPAYIPLELSCPGKMYHYWVHFTVENHGGLPLLELLGGIMETGPEQESQTAFLFDLMIEAFASNKTRLKMQAQGYLRLLLSRFIPEQETEKERDIAEFLPTLQYIEDNISGNLSNSVLSKLHGWHPTYFANRFSNIIGTSPRAYIMKKRIEKARKIIWDYPIPLEEVAGKVGFDDVYYFMRVFKKLTGIPPGQYRKRKYPSK